MTDTRENRIYFYQPRGGRNAGIDWFSGNTTDVQGLYNNFTGPVANNSFISAVFQSHAPRSMFLALDNYNRQQGIQLFTAHSSSAALVRRGPVTPPGVDARYPALTYQNEEIWLLYTVARENGEGIYRRLIRDNAAAGEPELLHTAPGGSGARALGYYTVNGVPVLIWHEFANKTVRGVWQGGEPFSLQLTGDANRVTLFGNVTNGRVRAAVERNGRLTFQNLEFSGLPAPPAQETAAPEPSSEPSSEPSAYPSAEDDPDPYPPPGGTDGYGGENGGENGGGGEGDLE
jgi:hypothetical protein